MVVAIITLSCISLSFLSLIKTDPILTRLQILFKYPPGKRAEVRESDLPSFCFPEGVKVSYINFLGELVYE